MAGLPRRGGSDAREQSVYLLQFRDRCKVGISAKPPQRLRTIHDAHLKACGEGVRLAAISEPTEHARSIEQSLLSQFGVLRLAGEYLAVDFATLSTAASVELERAGRRRRSSRALVAQPITEKEVTPIEAVRLRPHLRQLGPDRYAVEWYLHDTGLWVSEWQTLSRTFEKRSDARQFLSEMIHVWLATHAATGITVRDLFGLRR